MNYKNLKWVRLVPDQAGKGGIKSGFHSFQARPINDTRMVQGFHVWRGRWRKDYLTQSVANTSADSSFVTGTVLHAIHPYVYPSLTDPTATPGLSLLEHKTMPGPPGYSGLVDMSANVQRFSRIGDKAVPGSFVNLGGRCFFADGAGEAVVMDDRPPAIHAQPNQALGVQAPPKQLDLVPADATLGMLVGQESLCPYATAYRYFNPTFGSSLTSVWCNSPDPNSPIQQIKATDVVTITFVNPTYTINQGDPQPGGPASPALDAVTSNTAPFTVSGTLGIDPADNIGGSAVGQVVRLSGGTWPNGADAGKYIGLSVNFNGLSYVIAATGAVGGASAYDIDGNTVVLDETMALIRDVYTGPVISGSQYTVTGVILKMGATSTALTNASVGVGSWPTNTLGYGQSTLGGLVQVKVLSKTAAGTFTGLTAGLVQYDITCVQVDPTSSLIVYAGTANNGIFRSADGGATWAAINTGLTDLKVQCIAIDPGTPTTIYVGTAMTGVFKTTNSGTTWAGASTGLGNLNVPSIAIDPSLTSVLYAATSTNGVYKSTTSAGAWATFNTGLTTLTVYHLAIDPLSTSIVYAATAGGVFRYDSGLVTWVAKNTNLTQLNDPWIAIDPVTPTTLYLATLDNFIWKTTNSGTTWAILTNGLTSPFFSCVVVDPVTPATLYAGALSSGFAGVAGGLFKSTDSGATWALAGNGIPAGIPISTIAVDPSTPTTIYAGTFSSGLYKSTTGAGVGTIRRLGRMTWTPDQDGPKYAYAFYDPETGHISNISPITPLTNTKKLNIAGVTPYFAIDPGMISYPSYSGSLGPDAKRFSHIIFFRTEIDGSTLYPIGSIRPFVGKVHPGAASTRGSWNPTPAPGGVGWLGIPSNNTDAKPANNTAPTYWYDFSTDADLLLSGGFRAPQETNGKPIVTLRGGISAAGSPAYLAAWDGRTWLTCTEEPDVLKYSCDAAQCPFGVPEESFPPTNFLRIPSNDGRILSIRTVGEGLLVTTERWAYTVVGNDPSNYRLVRISTSMPGLGLYQMAELPADTEGSRATVFFMGRDKLIYQWVPGGPPVVISTPVQDIINSEVTSLAIYKTVRLHCASAWARRVLIVTLTPTIPGVLVYDIDNQVWAVAITDNGSTRSTYAPSAYASIYGLEPPVNEIYLQEDNAGNSASLRSWLRDDGAVQPLFFNKIVTEPMDFDGMKRRKQIVAVNLHVSAMATWTVTVRSNEVAGSAITCHAYGSDASSDAAYSVYGSGAVPVDAASAADLVVLAAEFATVTESGNQKSLPLFGYRFEITVASDSAPTPNTTSVELYAIDVFYIDLAEPGEADT